MGVQGDGHTYGHPIVLRPVSSEDALTADWTRLPYDVLARISTCIINSLPGVNRVVLDVTSKPPVTIEWGYNNKYVSAIKLMKMQRCSTLWEQETFE